MSTYLRFESTSWVDSAAYELYVQTQQQTHAMFCDGLGVSIADTLHIDLACRDGNLYLRVHGGKIYMRYWSADFIQTRELEFVG